MSELTKALIQFHKDVDKIEKNARANYGKFADLANVLSTVTPALLKNDLVITQEFFTESLVTTLRHVSGEIISSTCNLAIAQGRNVTQEWGKAVTYQRRYAIVSLLGLVADMDMDGAMLEDAKPEPAKPKSTPKPAAKNPRKTAAAPAPTPTPVPTSDKPHLGDPLKKEEVDAILELLIETRKENMTKFEKIQKEFLTHFKIASDCRLSESITTHAHLSFINERI
jgi:hypothetical protein